MISVDISNIWGDASLPDLLALEIEAFDAHKKLSEKAEEGHGAAGWLELPRLRGEEEIGRILAVARKIREESDVLVVLGAGGWLSARACIELLQGPQRNLGKGKGDPQLLFTGNSLSARAWQELVGQLEGKDVSLCVISGPDMAQETGIAFRGLRWLLERRYGTDGARDRIYAVAPGDGVLRQMALEEGWECFDIPEGVEENFSLLSPAGLLPMSVAGVYILPLLQGAEEARETYDLRSYENPVWLYAACRNLLYRKGKKIEVLESFEPGFRALGLWWQRLFAAAEGWDGKGIFPAYAELTDDLHGLGRMICQGERTLFETAVRFAPSGKTVQVTEDVRNRDGLNSLAGKTLDQLEQQAFEELLETHVDSGTSVICIDCPELCEQTLGELIWFFQLGCVISACMLGLDPFHGPEAESPL